jgi:flagellar hook protein FlgE
MAFRVAISGLKAASGELDVIGNNIANSNTTGFKKSRAEFVDVFAVSRVGGSSTTPGSGVRLSAIKQQFAQGNVSFTDNNLDMAINGNGFFILDDNGSQVYSRNGAFGVDRNGFLSNAEGQNLIAFGADTNGNITGAAGPIQVNSSNIPPQASTAMTFDLNLDAAENAPAINVFSSTNPNSFNHATSTTIFDSLGNSHLASMYYVKTEIPAVPTTVAPGTYTAAISDGSNAIQNDSASGGVHTTSVSGAAAETYSITVDGVTAFTFTSTGAAENVTAANIDAGITANLASLNAVGITVSGSAAASNLVFSRTDGASFDVVVANGMTGTAGGFAGADYATGTNTVNNGATAVAVTDSTFTMSVDGTQIYSEAAAVGATVTAAELDGAITSFITASNGAYSATGSIAAGNLVLSKADGTNVAITIDSNFSGTAGSFGGALTSTNGTTAQPTNSWNAYTFVDGTQVGGPDTLSFSSTGGLTTPASGTINISAFTPSGGGAPITLTQDYSATTQFGSAFSVNALSQDGFTTGRLSGLDIDGEGIIFARFTNGQSSVQGQIALADFANAQGLQPVSDTSWGETFASGAVTVGSPGTASLGLIQAGALEQSNVDLSEELVNMIIAQRSFQANAEVISTSDTVTQSIINLR